MGQTWPWTRCDKKRLSQMWMSAERMKQTHYSKRPSMATGTCDPSNGVGRSSHDNGLTAGEVSRPQGREMGQWAEHAGESECPTVMVGIGTQLSWGRSRSETRQTS